MIHEIQRRERLRRDRVIGRKRPRLLDHPDQHWIGDRVFRGAVQIQLVQLRLRC